MKDIDDGGPAFPTGEMIDPHDGRIEQYMVGGMTLRDYFAAAALNLEGIDNVADDENRAEVDRDCNVTAFGYAKAAYRIADAMLRAREAKS